MVEPAIYKMTDVYFGYRISLFGKPTCWKGDLPKPTMHSSDDMYYPFHSWKRLKPEEFELTLDELLERYPFNKFGRET